MHEETYPAFFTPRDEEPSLSSSEEKSSEFDWLEIRRTRKKKQEKQSKCSIRRFHISILYLFFYIGSKIYIQRRYFLRNIPIISLTDYKEKIKIYTKYLERKNLTQWQISRSFKRNSVARGLRNIAAKRTPFRSQRLISQPFEICLQLGVIGFQWL